MISNILNIWKKIRLPAAFSLLQEWTEDSVRVLMVVLNIVIRWKNNGLLAAFTLPALQETTRERTGTMMICDDDMFALF